VLVQRLEAAGAVLVGALNMDEYAYGFTTENSHVGACHNPHDLARIAAARRADRPPRWPPARCR
jgi:Asp-tRNA(Asn)/Glu-tRNA(Gln) amidotransferase A subunit family amidase